MVYYTCGLAVGSRGARHSLEQAAQEGAPRPPPPPSLPTCREPQPEQQVRLPSVF